MNVTQPLHCALFVLAADNNFDNIHLRTAPGDSKTYINFGVWWKSLEVQQGVGKRATGDAEMMLILISSQ